MSDDANIIITGNNILEIREQLKKANIEQHVIVS